jgi:hypothetical protein
MLVKDILIAWRSPALSGLAANEVPQIFCFSENVAYVIGAPIKIAGF